MRIVLLALLGLVAPPIARAVDPRITGVYYHLLPPPPIAAGLPWSAGDQVDPSKPRNRPDIAGNNARTKEWYDPGYTAIHENAEVGQRDDMGTAADQIDPRHAEIINEWAPSLAFVEAHTGGRPLLTVEIHGTIIRLRATGFHASSALTALVCGQYGAGIGRQCITYYPGFGLATDANGDFSHGFTLVEFSSPICASGSMRDALGTEASGSIGGC